MSPEVDPALIPRTVRLAAIVGAAVLVLGGVGAAALLLLATESPSVGEILQISFLAVAFGCYAALACCFRVTFRLNRVLVALTGRDPDLQRRLYRVIVRDQPAELSSGEEPTAARYAEVLSVSIPFSTGYFVLLYTGLLLQQTGTLLNPTALGIVLPAVLVSLLLVLGAVAVPLNVQRGRRARRYAAAHADLLDATLRQAQGTGMDSAVH